MSDFRPGDVVVCLKGRTAITGFRTGAFYRVEGLDRDGDLFIEGMPRSPHPAGGWSRFAFRKIRPASEQFTRQVRACRPIKQRETS